MATPTDPTPEAPTAIHPETRVALAVARFNHGITSRLLEGALAALAELGLTDDRILVEWVPGAFELPIACRWLAGSDFAPTAVVGLGCVIRGETDHYDYVCGEAARGTMEVGLDTDVPVAFGVLTCNTRGQAEDRAGGEHGNKGRDVVLAALQMADLKRRLLPGA